MTRFVRGDGHPRRIQVLLLTLLALGPACQLPTRRAELVVETPLEDSVSDSASASDPASASARETAPDPSPPPSSAPAEIQAVERTIVELLAGMSVRLLPAEASLEVDGWVNMNRGPVEVFACAPGGKTHESVVVLDCIPSGLHAGLLALGLSPGSSFKLDPDGTVQPPSGDGVRIEVRWTGAAGRSQVARAEDWIWDVPESRAMEPAAWIFVGSFLLPQEGRAGETSYAANVVKSLVTVFHDASAILENPWPGADDTRYHANIYAVPEVGTPVTIRFSPDR